MHKLRHETTVEKGQVTLPKNLTTSQREFLVALLGKFPNSGKVDKETYKAFQHFNKAVKAVKKEMKDAE